MGKVGVLVFTKDVVLSGRADKKNYFFDSYSYSGLNKILKDLECNYEYCSPLYMNEYEYVLVSLISYLDLINIINNIPIDRKCKIVVGGPACNNIRGVLPHVDIACFGRCDGGMINEILSEKQLLNVWYKKNDPEFSGEYTVGVATTFSENEKSVGCKQKCSFCFYSYWNKFVSTSTSGYKSGFDIYEDFIQTLDWNTCRRGGVTAIDGCTEQTRLKVNKKITYSDIVNCLLKSNDVDFDKKLRLKIYCMVGYEWEDRYVIKEIDLLRAISEVKNNIKNKIVIKLHISHFIPFQKTPLWDSAFNFNNYQQWSKCNPVLIDTGNIQLYSGGSYNPSPASAAVSTLFQRATNKDYKLTKIVSTKRFQSMDTFNKIINLKKMAMHIYERQDVESIPNIKTHYNYQVIKNPRT